MEEVRLGIIGLGTMGQYHLRYMHALTGVRVTALCDTEPDRAREMAKQRAPKAESFIHHERLLESGLVDAVLIATPHYEHPPIAIAALQRDLHVLTEKPVAVTVGAARQLTDFAATKPNLKFAAMFQQRVLPQYVELRRMIRDGELGEITRLTWIVTDWFRPWSYYASGSWRATWAGEGGGVLLNQCPHNLDLMCWITGMMPKRIVASVSIGKTHPIETDDEVSAILEYDNGCTGHFITSTGEAPGTNLLELACDRGLVRIERGRMTVRRTAQSVRGFRETSPGPFSMPPIEEVDVELDPPPENPHRVLTQNFVDSLLTEAPLIAPAIEGTRGLELGNAMLMAGVTGAPVELPLDAAAYEVLLRDLERRYSGKKNI